MRRQVSRSRRCWNTTPTNSGLTLEDIRNWTPPADDDPSGERGSDDARKTHQRIARSCRKRSARGTSFSTCPRASPSPRRRSMQYVVTPQLVACFDDALSFIKSAVEATNSKACYLHGSFGSGKSHFMAVLHLLLQHNPAVRSIAELAKVCGKHDWVENKKFLLVPYHMIGARNMESAILGGYVDHVMELHPRSAAAGRLSGRRHLQERPAAPAGAGRREVL